jgi:DNA invertase Pin-like site-specific DNA recombinase
MEQLHDHRALPGETLSILSFTRTGFADSSDKAHRDQEAVIKQWVDKHIENPVVWHFMRAVNRGAYLDRDSLYELLCLIEAGRVDVLVVEHLMQIMRRRHVISLAEICEELGVRLVGVNDGIDTDQRGWRLRALFADLHSA